MTKVKVFNFEVSNCAYGASKENSKEYWYKVDNPKLVSYDEIERILTDFLKDKNYIDMKVTTVDANYHNNALANTIILVYSIVYTDQPKY